MTTDTKPENARKICSHCVVEKDGSNFYKNGKNICRDCNNARRRQKYADDDTFRKNAILQATKHKSKQRQLKRQTEQDKIGIGNKCCRYCDTVKPTERFRHNRLKCRDCERDEPVEKFKRYIRTRIYNCLRYKNKVKHAIDYLGCSTDEYVRWMLSYNPDYTLDNNGKEWHTDHVIPISRFDLNNVEEQFLAFNWRNTMPLSCQENLSKNNRINVTQIKTHYDKLIQYHITHNIEMPKEFIELFAKHLVDGDPLKLSLPFTLGNICEELG